MSADGCWKAKAVVLSQVSCGGRSVGLYKILSARQHGASPPSCFKRPPRHDSEAVKVG
jgi:hypothetical protein